MTELQKAISVIPIVNLEGGPDPQVVAALGSLLDDLNGQQGTQTGVRPPKPLFRSYLH